MADSDVVCKHCNLRQRDATFALALSAPFEDNVRILGMSSLKCLDMEECCRDLGCLFAQGAVNPFTGA